MPLRTARTKLSSGYLTELLDEYQFDADRIWNLEETEATVGKDVNFKPSPLRTFMPSRFEVSKDRSF